MFNDKQQQIIARINDAFDRLAADESIQAMRALRDEIRDCLGRECCDIDDATPAPGEPRHELWVAFDDTDVAARITLHHGTVRVSGDDSRTVGCQIVSEALWCLEQSETFVDGDDLAQRVGYEG